MLSWEARCQGMLNVKLVPSEAGLISMNVSKHPMLNICPMKNPDSRLKAAQALVYLDEESILSDLSDDELFMEIDVKGLLERHNAFRGQIEDKSVSRQFEKVVYLEDDLDPNDLRFHVITEASFNV